MIKNLLRVLLIAALLLALAFVGLIFLVNPNQFRGAIEQAVLDSTGYELNIAGDLDLQFTPYFGLTLKDVRLRNPASPQELASTTEMALRVDPGLLLQGELLISEFRADDFHINYFTDSDGNNIWDVARTAGATGTTETAGNTTATNPGTSNGVAVSTSSAADASSTIRTSFERIAINNASVDIQDLRAGTRYSVQDLNLDSRNVSLDGRSFPVEIDFLFLNNGITEPVPMGLRGNVEFNQTTGTLNLNDLNFNLTPVLLQGQIAVTGLNDALQYEGSFQSNEFAITDLLQTLSPTDTYDSMPGVSTEPPLMVTLAFNGNQTQITIPEATATLGSTRMQADGNIRLATTFEPAYISYELISNALDITPFMAAEATSPGTMDETAESPANSAAGIEESVAAGTAPAQLPGATTAQAVDTLLPLDLLNGFNVLGSISIESITARSMVFTDINIFTNLEDGVLDVESQPISAFEGTILGNIRVDGRSGTGELTTQLAVNQLNIGTFTPAVSRLNAVSGRLDVEAAYSARGTTTREILDSLNGSTQFAITENSVDIGVVKQVFTAISALSTSGEAIQQWPDVIRFQEFSGYILLENGIAENQQVKIRMDNFDITGTGGLDLSAETFDYDLLFTVLGEPFVQTIQISPRYHDISWPVQCSSAFDDAVNQYCRPDFAEVRQIFTQMGTNEVRRRLEDVVNDQVPAQLQDTARGLLRNIFN